MQLAESRARFLLQEYCNGRNEIDIRVLYTPSCPLGGRKIATTKHCFEATLNAASGA